MLPRIYLIRHGETKWSLSGQHTSRTDIPLTEQGESDARKLGERLRGLNFSRVFTGPRLRAQRTCELAGLVPAAWFLGCSNPLGRKSGNPESGRLNLIR